MYKTYEEIFYASDSRMNKLLLVMKLSVMLLFAAVLNVSASGFAQKISLSEKDVPLKKVFSDLRKLSHFDFIYTDEQIHDARVAELHVQGAELKDVLDRLLKDLPLTYTIDDHTVVVRDKPKNVAPLATPGPGQPITIAGIVQDGQGTGLSGASISTKHGKQGATTDLHGFFQLKNVSDKDTLIVTYIGYKTKTVPIVGGKTAFPIIHLEEATDALDQIVVQGYGHTTQRLTTSDIGRISAAEIAKQPVNDPLLAIEGKVAGVVVSPQSGYEGGGIKIEIRGRSAISSLFTTDPLYVIDGVPLTVLDVGGINKAVPGDNSVTATSKGLDQTSMSYSTGQSPLYNINPADIESIEILKDADATAIYGSRGANGVILITTKRGKAGANSLDLSASQGVNFNTRTWPLLNTKEYNEMRREELRNDGNVVTLQTAPDFLSLDTNSYTNWPKYAYGGVGQATTVQGSVSGGTEQTLFRIGAGYSRSTDITRITGADQRLTIALNLSHTSPNRKFTSSISANYAYSVLNQLSMGGIATLPPDAPPAFDKQGRLNYEQWDAAKLTFPFSFLLQPYNSSVNGLTTNLTLSYNILKGLKASVSFGYNNSLNNQNKIMPLASKDPIDTTSRGSNTFGVSRANNWIVEPQLTYTTSLDKSKIDMLLGATDQGNTTAALSTTGSGYTSDALIHAINLAPTVMSNYTLGQYKYSGAFARLTYNYDNKYIVNLNGRRDGSSRFGPANRFGNFGSVGAAWIMSDEKWIRQVLPEAINFAKLRGSYGTTGSDAVGEYQYLSQWGNNTLLPTYNGVAPLIPLIDANPNFHWQVNKKLEGALQLEFFESKLSMELAYYRNRCNNQLVGFPLPEFAGFTTVTANDPADLQNSGFEATISATPIRNAKFRWNIGFNIGINRNKLLAYPDLVQSPYATRYKIGQSINNTYVLNYTGIDPMTGQITFQDHNHDGVAKEDDAVFPGTHDDDRRIKIDQEPNYTGGMSTQFSYKTFMVSTAFTYARQKGINLLDNANSGTSLGLFNLSQYVYDHVWRYPGQTNALFPKLSASPPTLGNSNAGWSDASYVRWSNVVLSYSLPAKVVKKAGLKGMSINIQGYNIMVFSPYKGLDPEVRTFGGLPPSRKITGGITCSF